jgi:hypothetical protein
MTLAMLADVRTLLDHVPAEHTANKKTGVMSPQNSMRLRAARRWLKYSLCCAWCWRLVQIGGNQEDANS